MRNGLFKLACIFTMLALVLTGCSLIEVDPVMQAAENTEKLNEDYSKVIVKYDGGEITKGELVADYYTQYTYYAYMYSMYYGTTISESEAQALAQSVAQSYMNTTAVVKKAEELGIALTDEEIAECEEFARTSYQESYDGAYESAEGDTDELRAQNAEYSLSVQGVSYDYYYRQKEWDLILTKVQENVMAEAPELTEEELELKLAEQTITDEQTYSEDRKSFETDMADENVCVTWMPEGYRTVKHILLIPSDEILEAYTAASSALTTANTELANLNSEKLEVKNGEAGEDARSEQEIQADIDAKKAEIETLETEKAACEADCIADVQDKVDEVYAKLDAGDSFEDVMAEYGEDPGMQEGVTMTRGYYVCDASEAWDYNFRNAAMDLENVGDYSDEPVVGSSGVHIIYYNSDVTPGAVALDDIREEFTASAQEESDNTYFNAKCSEWVSALNPKYNINNFFSNED